MGHSVDDLHAELADVRAELDIWRCEALESRVVESELALYRAQHSRRRIHATERRRVALSVLNQPRVFNL